MSTSIELIVGLGNPGTQYDQTRHNAGFWLVDQLATQHHTSFKPMAKFAGEFCQITMANQTIKLLKPTTFMNRSGQAIAKLAHYYKIAPPQILIAHDELDFPAGKVRLKQGGGHGGHNGLRDSIAQLGEKTFLRLRIGIDHPGDSAVVAHYVLSKASQHDQQQILASITQACDVIPLIATGELQKAMHQLHSVNDDG